MSGGYCVARGLSPLPASPDAVAGFVVYCKEAGKKPATLSRYLSTELEGMTNEVSVRQRQARGLGMAEIQSILNSPGSNLPTIRERAMLCVAYDAMTRRAGGIFVRHSVYILCIEPRMRCAHVGCA